MITAVVYHPRKARLERVRELIEAKTLARGWRTLWLPTSVADPGGDAARRALDAGARLVFATGGDGTVRAVCGALVGSDVPVGLLPAGTGNLLARNLGLPMTLGRGVRRAFTGRPTPIDLIRYRSAVGEGFSAVMAGLGSDAAVLADTDERLKGRIGPAAYAVAGLKHLRPVPVPTRISVDNGSPERFQASLVEVGNVGALHRGIHLLRAADASDGLLDALVASPQSRWGVLQLAARVLLRLPDGSQLARWRGRRVRVELGRARPFQVDGDVLGETSWAEFEVLPEAVRVLG